MNRSRRSATAMMFGMAATAAMAAWARPTILESDTRPGFDLESLIPQTFADWRVDRNVPVVVPPPDQQALLNKIYNQTLARTYVNQQGSRVMLSLAYGGDQSDGLSVHLPEVCYVGQGFRLERTAEDRLAFGDFVIPVRRVYTTMGPRHEPITYWVTMGDEATVSAWRRRMVSIRYGLRRRIPTGLLVRVSSIDVDVAAAYALHDRFMRQLVAAVRPADRELLVGSVPLQHS